MIELLQGKACGITGHLEVDQFCRSEIPGSVTPFLEKVGISLGLAVNLRESVVCDGRTLVLYWLAHDFI